MFFPLGITVFSITWKHHVISEDIKFDYIKSISIKMNHIFLFFEKRQHLLHLRVILGFRQCYICTSYAVINVSNIFVVVRYFVLLHLFDLLLFWLIIIPLAKENDRLCLTSKTIIVFLLWVKIKVGLLT